MFSWLKKRCRRKSAPSTGVEKRKLAAIDLKNEIENHDYEEIDDITSSDQLAYAIVPLTEKIKTEHTKVMIESNKLKETICPVCRRCQSQRPSTVELVCFCSVLNSNVFSENDDYELPVNLVANSGSQPDDIQRLSKLKRTDFSKRPLPELPHELQARSRQPISILANFAQLSDSNYSNSSSSGYFDSSFNSQTDTSSDDSFIDKLEKMSIRQTSQPTVCYSPPRPRMGCRALNIPQTMRRCRSTNRTNFLRIDTNRDHISSYLHTQQNAYKNPPFNRTGHLKTIDRSMSSSRISRVEKARLPLQRRGRSHIQLYENMYQY